MKSRIALPLSAVVHGAILVALSVMSFDRVKLTPPSAGMELEIIDVEHAMPLPDPSVAKDDLPAPAPVEQDIVAIPRPATASQIVAPAPPPRPLPQPASLVAPPAKAATPPVLQLGPGPVSALQEPPHPAPRPSAVPVAARSVPSAAMKVVSAFAPAQLQPRFDAGAISRMLASKSAAKAQTRIHSGEIGSAIGRAAPRGAAALTARQRMNLEEMIRSQIVRCWNPPVNEDEAGSTVTVLMHIRLDRSGALVGPPEVVAVKGANSANGSYSRAFAASVRRAISRCSPLRLPSELFDAWSDVELNFDPKDVT